ncbi:MAG: tRNA pseudouridine(55) synthase TruB, partial [Defluviitaleaceae bacterium]|nr:tRNA pseudouridine(55) synthase TruB [Defluviitaleaceae bacterium]
MRTSLPTNDGSGARCGFVNLCKRKGYTSHDAVAIIKKLYGCKAGHTGTLDPQAEGVLPICVGRATKLAGFFSSDDKEYEAVVLLGITTDTGDITGNVLLQNERAVFGLDEICRAAVSFTGEYMQTPPMHSAIKINGKKLYELARKGITVEREKRPVKIDRLEVKDYSPEKRMFTILVACSKGTYVRSLCEDIGKKLGCGACMGALVRTRSGRFKIGDSVTPDGLRAASENGTLNNYLIPVETVLQYPRIVIGRDQIKRAQNGNPINHLQNGLPS